MSARPDRLMVNQLSLTKQVFSIGFGYRVLTVLKLSFNGVKFDSVKRLVPEKVCSFELPGN